MIKNHISSKIIAEDKQKRRKKFFALYNIHAHKKTKLKLIESFVTDESAILELRSNKPSSVKVLLGFL